MATQSLSTRLAFHRDGTLHSLKTLVTDVARFEDVDEVNQQLFKQGSEGGYHAVATEATVFHPQGGGQPSDVGVIKDPKGAVFEVLSARMDAVQAGRVLHFGRYQSTDTPPLEVGDSVEQVIDQDKRLLFSRLHTAGHVLGAAVRHLLQDEVEGFDELKASHFPDQASCEFQGLIEGKWKAPIQAKVDEYIKAGLPVEIDWWTEEDFHTHGLQRLTPDKSMINSEGKFRIVNIKGAEVYPCGGTHVASSDKCGETVVKKISRAKGQSRVSYTVK